MSHFFLWHKFDSFIEKDTCTKCCDVLISFHKIIKLQYFEIDCNFLEQKSPLKFHGVFYHFSQPNEGKKFLMTKQCLDASELIQLNENT